MDKGSWMGNKNKNLLIRVDMMQDFINNIPNFLDSTISDIDCDGKNLILSIPNDNFENTLSNTKIIIEIEEYSLCFLYTLKKAVFHKIRRKSKEISLKKVKRMINSGKEFQVNDVIFSSSQDEMTFECAIVPYAKGKKHEYLCIEICDCKSISFKKLR